MKISKDEAIKIAEKLIKELQTPYNSVNASHVEAQHYWLVAFESGRDDALMDGNVSFVMVDDETGAASLRPHP